MWHHALQSIGGNFLKKEMKILWSNYSKCLMYFLVIILLYSLQSSLPLNSSNYFTMLPPLILIHTLYWWRNVGVEGLVIIVTVIDIPVIVRMEPQSYWISNLSIFLISDTQSRFILLQPVWPWTTTFVQVLIFLSLIRILIIFRSERLSCSLEILGLE